jgi:1-acyl-sn-glycerol-3-phosphate acyltransferase
LGGNGKSLEKLIFMKKYFEIFAKIFFAPIFRALTKKVNGTQNLSNLNPPFIVASNHIDSLDHFFIGTLFEKKLSSLSFLAAFERIKNSFFLLPFYFLGEPIIINRQKMSRKEILQILLQNLKEGKIIVIYPEGDTNRKKILLRGKTGIAELALKSKVKILPLGLVKFFLRREINIGKPMELKEERELFENLKEDTKEYFDFLQKTTDKIMREIGKLCQKEYPY